MKKIFYILAFILLFNVSNVYAFVNGQKFSEYLILYADFQGWTSTSTYKSLGTGFQLDSTNANTNNQVAYYYIPDSSLYNDTNGTSVKTYINGQIIKDNQVELSVGICTNRSSLDFIDYSALYLIDNNGGLNYQTFTAYTVNDVGTFVTDVYTFKCKEIYMTFTANVTSTSFMYRFYSNTTKPMGFVAYMGYHLNINGIDYTSQFNNLSNQNQILINQQQTIINQNQQTNEKLEDLDNTIKDESGPNTGALADSAGWLPAGPVDSILNLPLTLFQSLSNNIGATCTPLDITLPYVDKNITLPCLNSIYEQIDGLSVWINSIGIIASAFILYSYLLKLYKWVDDTLTFRENNHIDNWGGI